MNEKLYKVAEVNNEMHSSCTYITESLIPKHVNLTFATKEISFNTLSFSLLCSFSDRHNIRLILFC